MNSKFFSAVVALFVGVGAAQAADLPARMVTKAPAMAPVMSWTGVYVGAYGGYGWAASHPFFNGDTTGAAPGDDGHHVGRGGLAGGTLGINYQTGMWVFGVEADGGWADITGRNIDPVTPALGHTSKIDALGTVAGRFGVAYGSSLFYVKGGGAWADRELRQTFLPTGATQFRADDTTWGWVGGAGVEYMFAPNWSVKAEYNFISLDRKSFTEACLDASCGGVTQNESWKQNIQVVKLGLNYRFSNWPWR